MNKKLVTSYLTAGFLFSFVLVNTASAFWPFDFLFKKEGEVKAETTDKKVIVGDTRTGGSRAYMTYQTLVNMNDACRRMLSLSYPTPTKIKITPSQRTMSSVDKTNSDADYVYSLQFEIDKKSETELNTIYNSLKARCESIANLTNRMQRIYKGNIKPSISNTQYPTPSKVVTVEPTNSTNMTCGGIAGLKCPSGYNCVMSKETTKISDAMGTCVKAGVRGFDTKE